MAHFMVYAFRRWHSRLQKKQDLENAGDSESLPEQTEDSPDLPPLESKETGGQSNYAITER